MTDHANRMQLPPGKKVDLIPLLEAAPVSRKTPMIAKLKERLKGSRQFIAILGPNLEGKSLERIARRMNKLMDQRDQQTSKNT